MKKTVSIGIAVLLSLLLWACGAGTTAEPAAEIKDEGGPTASQKTESETLSCPLHAVSFNGEEGVFEEYLPEDEEGQLLLIRTDREIREFALLSMRFREVDSDGLPLYETEERVTFAKLTPDKALKAIFPVTGDLPENAVRYVDQDGRTYFFSLEFSGMDGSPCFAELSAQ